MGAGQGLLILSNISCHLRSPTIYLSKLNSTVRVLCSRYLRGNSATPVCTENLVRA